METNARMMPNASAQTQQGQARPINEEKDF